MEYRGYLAAAEFDESDDVSCSRRASSGPCPIATFDTRDGKEPHQEFKRSIDERLPCCEEDSVETRKPFPGTLNVRLCAEDIECPLCDSSSVETTLHDHEFEYGSGKSAVTLRVELPVRRCMDCEFEFIDDEGERLRHEAVCRHLGVLTPAEVREIRESYGMTRAAFSEATGLGEATLGRWESGALIQNRANDLYLRLTRSPQGMALLKDLSVRKPETAPQSGGSRPRFQKLVLSKGIRQAQENFQIRPEQLPMEN